MTNRAPIASGFNVTLTSGAWIPLASLFTWSDPDLGDNVISFSVRDRDLGGGHLLLISDAGQVISQPENVLFDQVSISQLVGQNTIGNSERWFFVPGPAGSVDEISFTVYDSEGVRSNVALTTLTASASALPDLSIQQFGVTNAPLSPGSNLNYSFGWTLAGTPFGQAGQGTYNWNVGIYLSTDQIIDRGDTFLGNIPFQFSASPGAGGGGGQRCRPPSKPNTGYLLRWHDY